MTLGITFELIFSASQNKPDLGLLIEVVQAYEHLYNLRHKDYKNIVKKEESWQEIAGIVQMSGVYISL